jgi:hypothetical protein
MAKGPNWSPASGISVWPLPGSPSFDEHIIAANELNNLTNAVQEKQTSIALSKKGIPRSTLRKIKLSKSKGDT